MAQESSEKERKKEIEYVHTYIHTLKQQSINQPKHRTTLEIEESIHQAVKYIAAVLGTSARDLYLEGILKHLDSLIPTLPETIQLNIIRQVTMKQEADSEIVGLQIDLAHEQLAYLIKRVHESPKNVFLKDSLRKQLVGSFKLASTSGSESLKVLVSEARELLRGDPV